MFTENVLTWLRILAIRFSVNRLLYFWQWTSFRLDYKKQTLMLMSKSHLFLYFLPCHFFKSSLKLLNLVISRAIFSGCELAAGQARKEMIISNFNLVVRRLQIRAFSLCVLFACRCHLVGKVIIREQPIFRRINGSNQWFSAGCCQNIVRRCVEISDLWRFFYCDRARRSHWLQLRISKNVSRRSRIGHLYCCWSSRIPYSIVVFGYFV